MPDLIDTQRALEEALEVLAGAPALAVDTETDAFFAYKARVCLLQISVPGQDLLIDALADLDFSGLGALLGDANREVVLHAAENDVILLHHQFGWRIGKLLDTQIASFILGFKPYSLAGILEARFGVKLDKSQQRSDWSVRPLSKQQMAYASEDTRHLLELAADLKQKAEEAGRVEEIEWECRRVAMREWAPEEFDPEGFRRIAGAKTLDAVGLRILRELYLMRTEEAERRNRAPYRIAHDSMLVRIAKERLTGEERAQGFWRRYGKKVAAIVRAAPERGPVPEPRRARRRNEPVSARVKQRYERLRRWRTKAAEERGVESFVVARNELLMKIAATECGTLDELGALLEPFRLREYGEALLAAMLESNENTPGKKTQ